MQKYKVLGFYSWFGCGDIFNSRECVKELMEKIPADEYYFLHPKYPKMLGDITGLLHSPVNYLCPGNKPFHLENRELYINTWIGQRGKYVLPGVGVSIENLLRMYNDTLKELGFNDVRLNRGVRDYVPSIDYQKLSGNGVSLVQTFVESNKFKDSMQSVLISNGDVQSNQAMNFDFTPVISDLCDAHRDKIFIATKRTGLVKDNLFYTDDITGYSGADLNEISYLSTFTDVIVGRSSGPYVFAQVKENYDNPKKKLLSFTYNENAAHFIKSVQVPIKRYWSPATDRVAVVNKINEVLNG